MTTDSSKSHQTLEILKEKHQRLKQAVDSYVGSPAGLKILKVQKLRAKDAVEKYCREMDEGTDHAIPPKNPGPSQEETEIQSDDSTDVPFSRSNSNWGIENDKGEGNFDVAQSAA